MDSKGVLFAALRIRRLPHGLKVSAILPVAIFLASCGTANHSGGGGTLAPTASLTASPSGIFPSEHVTLTWSSTNGEQGSIDNGLGAVGLNGSTQLQPAATTTYTYTVTGPGGTVTASTTVTVNAINSFDGMLQSDGTDSNDVDPNGAVGTKQYLEYVNTSLQAYDKVTGNPVWGSPKAIGSFWPTGSPCNVGADGNPAIQLDADIIFDRLASRWVIGAKTSDPNLPQGYSFCMAVSNTDDLSSSNLSWLGYTTPAGFLNQLLGSNASGSTYFPDWPRIATWNDASGAQSAYYATIDIEDTVQDGSTELGSIVCAFDRTDMLDGGTIKPPACARVSDRASQTPTGLWSSGVFIGHSLIPAGIDGTTEPPAGRDEYMVSIQNPVLDGSTTTSNSINLWDFHIDWTSSTLTFSQSSLAVNPFTPGCYLVDPSNPAITNCVLEPYPGTQHWLLDSVGDRLMPRLAYRNFGSYESYLFSQTVQTASGGSPVPMQTGIGWYELRNSGSGTPSLYQSGTINPDQNYFRFVPSIAQDKKGNAVVGYSLATYDWTPEIDFSYWNLPSATTPSEFTIYHGLGEEILSSPPYAGKWGSYSSMTVDPVDDCTFWYVNEYFDETNSWRTRIANFKVPGCS